jgi:hypothetical protein
VSAKPRGRETALDMVRTLAVVFALVVPLWFFGQSSPSDSKRIRPVDASGAYHDFAQATHGPVPSATPAGWVCTVRDYITVPGVLRVGYVHQDHYVEFVGGVGTAFVPAATGRARRTGLVQVGETVWQDYRSADGHQSLLLTRGGVTVLVGGLRETASQDELVALARLIS